jgi:lipid II:glycine glycyltransferase (peptidoglycan interpeptide bridge formation enzyme)
MKLSIKPKGVKKLLPTEIVFQTEYWAHVKARLGWKPFACDIEGPPLKNDMLVLIKSLGGNVAGAFVPQGPEVAPDQEHYGSYLEVLSESIAPLLASGVAFIRYDLPWQSPYADVFGKNTDPGFPSARNLEMRMNIGTRRWNFRKAPVDMTVAHALLVDIRGSEAGILEHMKPKTRYNIGLALRKGVRVFRAGVDHMPLFYELYKETAARNGFDIGNEQHFSALFSPEKNPCDGSDVVLMLAAHGEDVLAGVIVTITGKNAYFLHGASTGRKRNLMASYALHWEVIRFARSRNCLVYDMGGVAPSNDSDHPFHGLYRFKAGFGGIIVHRAGSWDYPIDQDAYAAFRNHEGLRHLC